MKFRLLRIAREHGDAVALHVDEGVAWAPAEAQKEAKRLIPSVRALAVFVGMRATPDKFVFDRGGWRRFEGGANTAGRRLGPKT